MPKSNLKPIGLGVLTVILLVLPFILTAYYVDIMIMLLINILVVVSFRFIALTGDFSVAHIPLMGAGAYASALMGLRLGLPFWLTLPLAGLTAALVGLVMCYPLLRMKAFAFFLGSYAAGEAMRLSWIRFRNPFGGHTGITNVPPPESIPLPGLGTIDFAEVIPYYFLTLGVTALCLVIMYRLEKFRIGDTLKAIHSEDNLVKSVGINVTTYRALAFLIGSFFAGISGVLLVHRLGAVDPYQFSLAATLYLLVWVVVGGLGTFAGPIIGVVTLTVISELIRGFVEWVPLVYGFILIAILLFLPEGLEGLPKKMQLMAKRVMKHAGQ